MIFKILLVRRAGRLENRLGEKLVLLFSKKQPKNIIPVTIDLCDDHFILNGKQFTIPARASELVVILGEPRCVADRNHEIKSYKEIICEKYNLSPERYAMMDYYWDDLGLILRERSLSMESHGRRLLKKQEGTGTHSGCR